MGHVNNKYIVDRSIYMKKRGYIILISILLLGIIIGVGRFAYDVYKQKKLVKHVVDGYGFEISYPKTYKDVTESGEIKYYQILQYKNLENKFLNICKI